MSANALTRQSQEPDVPLAPPRGADEPNDPIGPTQAFRDASTPGPHEPDLPTRNEHPIPRSECPPPSRLPPIPGYEIEAFVGRGGMGVVYRARHLATERLVALKLIGPRGAGDDVTRERFVREVHSLARIKHPNVVPVYDAGDWHGFPYCTMEFVAGGTLNDHLDRFSGDPDRAVALLAKVARGVEALHRSGIIHRDLKPLNILLGPGDEPLVADFGLAKWLGDESDLTLTGLPVGTRLYMSPEQTLGRRESYAAACDVWALGVTLYEALTGHRPFTDDADSGVYHRIRTADPVPLGNLAPGVPAALQAVVLKCLAKRPEDRYQTAAELADELERWLRREPVLAPEPAVPVLTEALPASNAYPPRRWRRAAAILCVLLAVGAVGLLVITPKALRNAPVDPAKPPKKSIAERLEAGEAVPLTDDKGRLLVEAIDEPGHALQRDTVDGYQCFTRSGTGIANLLDERLPEEYRVEAVLGTTFTTYPSARGGIYVGRRLWGGLPFKHESVFAADIGSEYENEERRLVSKFEMYWWMRHENGEPFSRGRVISRWHPDNKDVKLRFAPVRIDVRGDNVEATVDGHQFKSLSSEDLAFTLNTHMVDLARKSRLPKYTCDAPYLGRGVGIYCVNTDVVVRNLTVTKLAPKH